MCRRPAWALLAAIAVATTFVAPPLRAQEQEITLPHYEGYISVAPDGRYFVDEAGQGFLVIGQNDGVDWPGLATLLDRSSPISTEKYILDLRAHGVTVSRVMIEYAEDAATFLENPVGVFSPRIVQFWDDLIPLAEKHGLYLLLTPYDPFWITRTQWDTRYPYNAKFGGPCESKRDWIIGEACVEAQKNRWRFIIARWGNSPAIFAWDLLNEADIFWDATPDEVAAYVGEMAAFVHNLELETWGRAHLLTVSSAASVPEGVLAEAIYRHPLLDFATTHHYPAPEVNRPEDPIGAAPVVMRVVWESLQAIEDNRPYFDSESGPIERWIGDPKFDAEYHHNMIWAHLASGGAGSGMRWPYTFPHWILPELRDNLLGMARFASTIDWAHFRSRNINLNMVVDRERIIHAGCSDGATAVIWLLADTRAPQVDVTLPGTVVRLNDVLADGAYIAQFWETYRGDILGDVEARADGGVLEVGIPDFGVDLKDLALVLHPMQ